MFCCHYAGMLLLFPGIRHGHPGINCWHEVMGEKTIVDAIPERIVHDDHRLELKGESLRKTRAKIKEIETLS
jgi:hypothetical protein